MIRNLKLSTVFWIFVGLMVLTASAIVSGAFVIDRNISLIKDTWSEFQGEYPEKARLESALRSAIGYGGMIHHFKNYILRKDNSDQEVAVSKIGAAHAILHQYSDLEITAAEQVAIDDIEHVLDNYLQAVQTAKRLIDKNHTSITELDNLVKIEDSPALRGLATLRHEMRANRSDSKTPSKGRIIADLRAAMGYGGFIHHYKNYLLRRDTDYLNKTRKNFLLAENAISLYRNQSTNQSETIALDDIALTIKSYEKNLDTIQGLTNEGLSALDVDSSVRIDDAAALRGLHILDREINAKAARDSNRVTKSLQLVKRTVHLGTWTMIIIIIFVVLIAAWLFHTQIIRPVIFLTKNMTKLANNNLDVELSGYHRQNEVGKMANAIMFFKSNIIKRNEAEANLETANKEMNQQLKDNKLLRERAEEHTSKALSLAEGLEAARKSAEKAMTRAEADKEFTSSILNTVRDGIITINTKGIIEVFNPGAEDIFGYYAHDVLGENISMLMPEPHRSAHDGYLQDFMNGKTTRNQSVPLEQVGLRKNGETFPAEITLNTMHIGGKTKITGLVRDITERKKWEEEIKLMAMTDPLTGIANRNRYTQRLDDMEKQAARFNTPFALMQIDLDKFKPVNDTYGHPTGDALLQYVANTLSSSCRDVDTVARLGGDEFSIIINGAHKPEDVVILAQRIIDSLSQPINISDHTVQIGASIGISYYPNDTQDIEELIRMADEALYVAKHEGRNTFRIYSELH